MDEEIRKKMESIKEQMRPEDFYEISWAMFERARDEEREIEKVQCKRCWMKRHHNHNDSYEKTKKKAEQRYEAAQRINALFHECHNWSRDFINKTGDYAKRKERKP